MPNKESLKNRFENYGSAPNTEAWSAISAALPAKKGNKVIAWWLFAGSGVAAAFLLSFYFFTTDSNQNFASREFHNDYKNSDKSKQVITENERQTADVKNGIQTVDKSSTKQTTSLSAKQSSVKNNYKIKVDIAAKPASPIILKKDINVTVPDEQNGSLVETETEKISIVRSQDQLLDVEMVYLSAQETELLAINGSEIAPKMLEIKESKTGKWQYGGRISAENFLNNSSAADNANQQAFDFTNMNNNIGVNGIQENNAPSVAYSSINRTFGAAIELRYSPIPRLFIQGAGALTLFTAVPANILTASSFSKVRLFALGTDLKVGYKIVNQRRWGIDFAIGIRHERLLSKTFYIPKGSKIDLFALSTELGFNYYATEKLNLRLAPQFSRTIGQPNNLLEQQFKGVSNLGLNFSLLREF